MVVQKVDPLPVALASCSTLRSIPLFMHCESRRKWLKSWGLSPMWKTLKMLLVSDMLSFNRCSYLESELENGGPLS